MEALIVLVCGLLLTPISDGIANWLTAKADEIEVNVKERRAKLKDDE